MADSIWKPHVTVAAVTERDGKFLLVEELIDGKLVLNQPAGHLDEGESLLDAVKRETREESAWEFMPDSLIGLYTWTSPGINNTFLRLAFAGRCLRHHSGEPLDTGIQRVVWLSRDEIADKHSSLRSPMVLRCIDDYLAGIRYPLELLQQLKGSVPVQKP